MKYLAVLGRQREISLSELDALFRDVRPLGVNLATFSAAIEPDINRLGGTLKIARELKETPLEYLSNLPDGKITLGISDYSRGASAKKSNIEALKLKKILVRQGRSVRVLANAGAEISTAATHHNQLSEKPNHVEMIRYEKTWWVLTGVQNITAYARRDQARPARDAFVGMLPPKLAQILINLCGPLKPGARVLDPFCGSGVVLQEAYLMGYKAYGTDLSEKMVDYSRKNMEWLKNAILKSQSAEVYSEKTGVEVEIGDATSFSWKKPIDAIVCETYLGRPMSQAPAEIKLKQEKQECSSIILGFLRNLSQQIESGVPVVIAAPAWLRPDGSYSHLHLIDEISKMGYNVIKYKFAGDGLLYHREGQVVAREIIALRKK